MSDRSTAPYSVLRARRARCRHSLSGPRLVPWAGLLLASWVHAAQPLFDTHLHYRARDARTYSPADIVELLRRNEIACAVVTGTPPQQALALHRSAPQRILPFLGVYRSRADKETWHRDPSLPAFVEQQLAAASWRGLGELHLFAEDRHSPVFRRIVRIAAENRLPILLHADPAVVDTLYEIAPGVTVLWAHAGTFPYPDLLHDYLARYPRLRIDLSVRSERIAPDGRLDDAWFKLFLAHPDRFLVGVDTFSTRRWDEYSRLSERIRGWLSQLPTGIAEGIAHGNAERLFATEALECGTTGPSE